MNARHAGTTLAILVLLAGAVPAPLSTPQERPPRVIPPLEIRSVRPDAGASPSSERPLLEVTLTEAEPSRPAESVDPEVTPLPAERVQAILSRLPQLTEGAETSTPADARASADRETPAARALSPQSLAAAPPPAAAPRAPAEGQSHATTVVAVFPTGETDLAPHVTVVFSRPMVPLGRDGEPAGEDVPAALDPRPPGRWRWLDARTLRFEPDAGRLPGATPFRLRVPAGAAAADGTRLGAAFEATFQTAGVRALGGFPAASDEVARAFAEIDLADPNLADRHPDILLTFDQRVDPAAVLAAARLDIGGEIHTLRSVTASELEERDPRLAQAAREAGPGMWAALRPESPLPGGGEAVLTLDASLASEEGPLPAGRVQELRFRVRGPLEVTATSCGGAEGRCVPRGSWWATFSNPLDPDQPVAERVRVTPEVEGLRARVDPKGLRLTGDFRPHTRYAVRLSGELRDRFGQRLGEPVDTAAVFGAPVPWVLAPGAPFLVLDPAAGGRLELPVRAVDAVEVELYRVEPEDWQAYRAALPDSRWGAGEPWTPGEPPVARWTLEPDDGGRGYARVPLDLADGLAETGSQALLVATGRLSGPDAADRERVHRTSLRATTWIQSTSFAVGATWDPAEIVGWAVSLADGSPLEGVEVRLSGSGGGVRTDADGLARIPLPSRTESLLVARFEDETAMLPAVVYRARSPGWSGDPGFPEPVWFALTDRGLYRPGEVLEGHGWVRELAGTPRRDLVLPQRFDTVAYRIEAAGQRVAEGRVPVSSTGAFHVVARLPDDPSVGRHVLRLEAVGDDVEGWASSASFRVEDFRRPEYETEVQVDPGPHVAGTAFDVHTHARYYDGAGLPNSAVDWWVLGAPGSWSAPGWRGWRFGEGGVLPGRGWSPTAAELSGRTDAEGRHVLTIATGSPYRRVPVALLVRGQVHDVDRQVGSARLDLVIHPAAVAPAVRTSRLWLRAGEDLAVDVAVVDLEGRVVPGRLPEVRAVLEPDEARPGSTGEDEPVPLACAPGPEEEIAGQTVRPLRCILRPGSPGHHRVVAEARDTEGRLSTTELRIPVLPSGFGWSPGDDRLRVRLEPDREEYAPGDTARLLLSVPFHPLEGLLVVARHGIRELRPIRVEAPGQEIRIPIHPEDAGGLYVGLDLSALSRSMETFSVSSRLEVTAEGRALDVDVAPERAVVEPGDSVTVEVAVADAAGVPMADAEVALWLVDESVLALGGYALRDPLQRLHPSPFSSRTFRVLPHGPVHWQPRPLGPGTLTAEVVDVLTGNPAGRLQVAVDGEDRGSASRGRFLLDGIAPGSRRLVITQDGTTVLDETFTVPREGLNLGTILLDTSGPEPQIRMANTTFESNQVSELPMVDQLRAAGSRVMLRGAGSLYGRSEQAVPGDLAGAADPVAVRRDFGALAAFEPAVRLDGNGRAQVRVRLPDTPTRYRIFAVASEGATRFGTAESVVTATRDLIVRASPPRNLHPGDEPELPAIIQNASERAMEVEVAARTVGMSLTGTEGYRVRLPAGSRAEVRFPARATESRPGTLEVVAVAGGATELADAVRVPLPVRPALAPRAVAFHRTLEEGDVLRLPLEVPDRAQPGFGGVDVALSTTLLLPLVDVLRSLCLQPMPWPSATSARVIGLASLDGSLETLRAPDLPTPGALRAMLRADVGRLEGWLRSYRFGRANPGHGFASALSALHALHAMDVARDAGYGTNSWVWRSLDDLLVETWEDERDRQLADPSTPRSGWDRATAAYALHLGVRLGAVHPGPEEAEWLESVEPADLPVEVLAWLLGPAASIPGADPGVRRALLGELENRALTTGATVTFRQGEREVAEFGDLQRLLLASDRRSDAVGLAVLLDQEPGHPLIPGLVRGLLGHRDGTRAGGAHENGWVLHALGRYAAAHEQAEGEVLTRTLLDGRPLVTEPGAGPPPTVPAVEGPSLSLDRENPTAVASAPLPAPGERAVLEVRREGSAPLHVRAGIRYAPVVTADMPAEERGFMVSRRYEGVDDPDDVRRDADGTWRIRAGARVRVRLTFTAPERRYRVQLLDPVPGGLEVVNPRLRGTGFAADSPPASIDPPDGRVSPPLAATRGNVPFAWDLTDAFFRWRASWGAWATHQELRDDRMEAYTPYLPAGTYQHTYLVRATTPGTFLAPPPRVEETEHPETFGQGRADRVVVEGGERGGDGN